MTQPIAIVGMACEYPDARTPEELWENVLTRRRSFRRMPPERLCVGDYWSADPNSPDATYSVQAAVISDFAFDRVAYRVAASTFASADLAHWLALDVAARALESAGLSAGENLPGTSTGVFLGNTLTGEFSRANALRLRWPYVRRVVDASLAEQGWTLERRQAFLADLESEFKAQFPPVGEETLAGGLSNTIAGRICNHFDLKGGGYTVDGACASSLLAVSHACSALVAGDLDVALAGGVDLSLDPFELVGFAKAQALAADEMRVYDARSSGFWPGEGCGFVVLMRLEDALARGLPVAVVIRGWGISSDGKGGITRPEADGQILALRRAYARAGFGIDTVSYFEGHGTGTSVGDATELRALSQALRDAQAPTRSAVIGTIKANIGHTKAAAGVAGLIKAAIAVREQVVPPTTGCEQPHAELRGEAPVLRVATDGEPWPADRPLRAGVSAMGFGGINAHLALEGMCAERRVSFRPRVRGLLDSAQDAELFLFRASDVGELRQQIERVSEIAGRLSRAELADLAAELARTLGDGPERAAVVASRPSELADRLRTLRLWLEAGETAKHEPLAGLFLGSGIGRPRIGFLFPGQGSPAHADGGALRRRFASVRDFYDHADLPTNGDRESTAVAQPAIVAASLAAWRVLDRLGVEADLAVGHSLGELSALGWAGAFDADALMRIASARGRAMAERAQQDGVMVSLAAGRADVEALLNGAGAVIAGLNSPVQTVISGTRPAVASIVAHAREHGLRVTPLPVSLAFHSPLMAPAVPELAQALAREQPRALSRAVVSTVAGGRLSPDTDLVALLGRQVTSPVRFTEALMVAQGDVDLWIEVGPGQVLSGLARDSQSAPVVATDAGGPSLIGLLSAVGAAFALGAPVRSAALFSGRFSRPFSLEWHPRFFENPCEKAPRPDVSAIGRVTKTRGDEPGKVPADGSARSSVKSALALVRELVAEKTELPLSAIRDESHVLNDLHLNSISVGQLVAEAARKLGLPAPLSPTDFARATLADVAEALEDLARTGGSRAGLDERLPAGVDSWIRTFTVDLIERPLPRRAPPTGTHRWRVIAPPRHPLADKLERALSASGAGPGVAVCLPMDADETAIALMLEAARALREVRGADRFVLVQQGGAGASFARSLHLESSNVSTCVVDLPLNHPRALEWVVAEACAVAGYSEAHYDDAGTRREPRMRLLGVNDRLEAIPLGPDDLVLVSGGGKGIAAECALALGKQTGARLALLGRSNPEHDQELEANHRRFDAFGVRYRYHPADVTDATSVCSAVNELEADLGPITAILHGAGVNEPRLVDSLDEATFTQTRAPKARGARNLLAAIDADRLKLFVTFGSIIARTGMRGEAHYAVANEELARLTEDVQRTHPACRCLCLEWSIWSGVGMGDRLGRVDVLAQQGITPIPPDEGVATLLRLLAQPLPSVSVVVSGRIGEAPTLRVERPELPLRRFLEQPRVFYPGVELVVDVKLSVENDPYLNDHIFRGERLFPAALGLEAMAQVAMAVCETTEPPVFENLRLERPVVVQATGTSTIRLAALVRAPGRVEVVLRSENTEFQVNHFRATCVFGDRHSSLEHLNRIPSSVQAEQPCVPISPQTDLYGTVLFQKNCFERVRGYRKLRARECLAEVDSAGPSGWFHAYLPASLVLGDPGVRDAAMHAIQACIPHATILPIGADRLVPGCGFANGPCLISARERAVEADILIYDVSIIGSDGVVHERWEGLRLKVVERDNPPREWPEALLGPYCERLLCELIPGAEVAVVVERFTDTERAERSDRAIARLLERPQRVYRRFDGKPEVAGEAAVSTAHAGQLTLAIAGPGTIACDLELVAGRSTEDWQALLGADGSQLADVLIRELGEPRDVAATRVWVARECLVKAGAMPGAPIMLAKAHGAGWCLFTSGSFVIATYSSTLRREQVPFVLGVLVRNVDACL